MATILAIDDDENVLEALCMTLKSRGMMSSKLPTAKRAFLNSN
jgi:FixJ family two-component response regulator